MPFTDNLPEFEKQAAAAANVALQTMSSDIERLSKMIAPVKHGYLYSSVRHYMVSPLHWRVSFGEDSVANKYAVYQEMGERRDGTHVVRNYTKGGTGAHFLEIAGSNVAAHAPGTFKGVMSVAGRGLL